MCCRLNNVPDDEINKMTYENAMRWYSFDPFTHIPREQATVGALRKAAEGHDVSIKAAGHQKDTRAGSSFARLCRQRESPYRQQGLTRYRTSSRAGA